MFTKKADPFRLYLAMSAVWAVASRTTFTILSIYYVQDVGMNPIQLVLVVGDIRQKISRPAV